MKSLIEKIKKTLKVSDSARLLSVVASVEVRANTVGEEMMKAVNCLQNKTLNLFKKLRIEGKIVPLK